MATGLGLIGQKVGMTQIFDSEGRAVGATVLHAGPCTVTRLRKVETDGYSAVQVGYREEKAARIGKPRAGVFAKLNLPVQRILAEFRVPETGDLAPGSSLTVEIFKQGARVDVAGDAKGSGFQGVIRRHGFKGGPETHGSMSHRAPGSIGASTDPGHTLRGTRMAGRHGGRNSTSQNLEVLAIDAGRNILVVKGAVPGAPGTYVRITPTTRKKAPSARRLRVEIAEGEGFKTAAKKAAQKK